MKKIILILLIIQGQFFYGQQGAEKPKPIEFNASNRAGIIYYETEEVTENIKVKNEDLFYDVAKVIRIYNRKVKEVAFLNSKNFKEIDAMVDKAFNAEKPQGKANEVDPEKQKKKKEETEKLFAVLTEVRKKMIIYNKELDKGLNEILSKKQYNKWIKYKKRQIKTLLPERPKAPSSANTGSPSPNLGNRRNNQRGLGGGGFR